MNEISRQTTPQCKTCGTELEGKFCYQCGQKIMEGRLTIPGLFRELIAIITNVERGFWYTAKILFTNPGKIIRDVWNRATVPYYHPFRYVLIWATISVIMNISLGIFDSQQAEMQETFGSGNEMNEKTAAVQQKIMELSKKYMSFILIFIIPFISLVSRWFFKKEKLNYAEHLVMNTYFIGQNALLGLPTMLIFSYFEIVSFYFISVGLTINGLYLAYAFRSVFDISVPKAIFKGIFVYLIGYILYIIVFGIITGIAMVIYLIVFKGSL
jgi:hypothetical protein